MSNNGNFDPRQYPELFGEDDLSPLEMAILMSTMMESEEPIEPVNPSFINSLNDSPKDSPKNESLFSKSEENVEENKPLTEEEIMNNPEILQLLMEMMSDNNGNEEINFIDELNNYLNESSDNLPNLNDKEPEELFYTPEDIDAFIARENNITEIINNDISTPKLETVIEDEDMTINAKKIKLDDEPEEEININLHVKHKKKRCNLIECKSKLGLLGFDCKCGYKFCGKHRHTDTHHCTYDHMSEARKRLEKENPKIVNEKLNRI